MSLNYNSLSSLTRDKFIPVLVDNIFNSNVLAFKLLKNADKLDGGVKIITPLEYSQLSEGFGGATGDGYMGFYNASSDQLVPKSYDPFTSAEWNWKQAFSGLYITSDEEMKNQGDSQVLSLIKSKLKNAERSLKDLFGSKMFSTASVGANDITSIAYADDSTGNESDNHIVAIDRSLGGVDSTTYTWWDAQMLGFSGDETTGGSSPTWDEHTTTNNGVANIVKDMTRMYGSCSIDNDQVDLIVTTQVLFDAYESSLQASKRFAGDSTLADAGFQTLRFKGATIVVDSHCPDGHMYFLNTNYLDFKVHAKRDFSFEGFRRREEYDGQIARLFWMGNLVCTNARMQGVLKGGASAY